MTGALRHRGPDADGFHQHGPVVLGHRRLSIIDLSDAALQPMSNETGSLWVIFNGEIYNYRELRRELDGHEFRSDSDTEVILHGYEEWGIDELLGKLRGMFAFALYDAGRAARATDEPFLFLVRDRVGIKPLYYAENKDCLAFASEAHAIAGSGMVSPEADLDALTGFFCLGSTPAPRTCHKNIHCLPPGHYLAVSRRGARAAQYWDLAYGDTCHSVSAELLEDTVDRHLISDVPLGIFLSGGLDSAGLVALASRRRRTSLVTLTIAFEEAEFNEAPAAREFAEAFGTDHHEILVRDREFIDELPNILAAMDQPTADGVNTYFVSRAARQLGLTVVLSGLGGDEAFFGYPHYRRLAEQNGSLARYKSLPPALRRLVDRGASLYGGLLGREKWRRFDYLRSRSLNEGFYLLMRGFFPPAEAGELLGLGRTQVERSLEESFAALRRAGENEHLDAHGFHYLEMKRYLHDQLLRDSDVFSMAHSIELRVPYLDHEVLESACRIPAREKIAAGINKPKLVEALGHPLLEQAARRRKQGFTFPFARWMRRHADTLERHALDHGLLESNAVRRCWREFRQGRLHWSRAWATVTAGAAKA